MRRLALVPALLLAALACAAAPIRVRVYHTNDIHGWMMARADKDGRMIGGAPALAALLAEDATPRLLLDGGDWWQGTPEGSLTKGKAMVEIFNALRYDALAIGNHEYDAGWEALRENVGALAMPALSANVVEEKTGKRPPWVKPWTIVSREGIKFGIFGLTTSGMPRLAFPKHVAGLRWTREVDAAREAVAELKRAGAHVIIAVTHVGFERPDKPRFEGDQTLAREVPGIDLIVGGHTHIPLSPAYRDPRNGTLVVQAGQYLTKVGRATLEIDPATRKVVASESELLDLDPAAGEDPALLALVGRWKEASGKVFETVIATAAVRLEREMDRESPIGSWVADCIREWAGAEIAIQNGGGVRSELPAGPVTLRRVFDIMPYENTLVKLRMKGSALREALKRGLGAVRIAAYSGLELEFRRPAPWERRLVSASFRGKPLEDERLYSVVTINYLVDGGDGYVEFGDAADVVDTGVLVREALKGCFESQGLVAKAPPSRMKKRED